MEITHINPTTMHRNPAFSQGTSLEGTAKLIFVGGQNGIDTEGQLIAKDVGGQSAQALMNVINVLKEAGASQEHVLKMSIYLLQGQDINAAFGAAQEVWGPYPTAISVLFVAGLAVPGALVEIEAIAAI